MFPALIIPKLVKKLLPLLLDLLMKAFPGLEKIINDDLRQIIIVLISQQKKMQIELRGILKKYEALVEIINKLILRNDKK